MIQVKGAIAGVGGCFNINILSSPPADIHKTDAVNMMVHVMNSIMMLIDLAIVGQPIRMGHIYFTTGN